MTVVVGSIPQWARFKGCVADGRLYSVADSRVAPRRPCIHLICALGCNQIAVAKGLAGSIVPIMNLIRKALPVAALGLLPLLGTGCGGFTASRSVSPATFLLPGLLQVTPQEIEPAPSEFAPHASSLLARASDR